MKLQDRRRECGIEQADLASRVGTNAPMMSNFERYKCIPIPKMLEAICKELNCGIEDIYERGEIYLSIREDKKDKSLCVTARREPAVYKFSVRLPDEARKTFTQENLEKCGYHSLKDFAWHCWKRFEKQLAIVSKKEKANTHSNCMSAFDENGK